MITAEMPEKVSMNNDQTGKPPIGGPQKNSYAWLRFVLAALIPVAWWCAVPVLLGQPVRTPFTLMLPPVLLASWWGGLYAGLVATVLAVLGAWDLGTDSPFMDWTPRGDQVSTLSAVTLFVTGLLVTFMYHNLRQHSASLSIAEERILRTTRAANIGFWENDLMTGKITWSTEMLEFRGISEGEFDGTFSGFEKFTHPEDLQRIHALIGAVGPGERFVIEFRVLQPNGQIRWIEARGQLLPDATGRPVQFSGTEIDITQRKKAEAASELAHHRMQLAVKVANIGIWEWDLASNHLVWDPRMFEMYGVSPTADGKSAFDTWHGALHPDDVAAQDAFTEAVLQGQNPSDSRKFRIIRQSDGQVRHIEAAETLLRDAAGNPIKLLGTNVDVTERKEAEAAVAAEGSRSTLILQTASDGIHVLDVDGNVHLANDAFAASLGYTAEEVRRLNVRDWEDQIPHDQIQSVLDGLFDNPDSQTFESRHRRKDGRVIDVEVNVRPVTIEGQCLLYASSRDITARKHLEQSLLDERNRLDETVLRRTLELQNAKDAAESAARAKSDFLANVSHEVRSPMSVIVGYSDLLLDPETSPIDRKAAAAAIRRNGQHLLQVINDVLDISRIEAGKMPVELADVAPWELLQAVFETYQVQAAEKQIQLTLTAEGVVPASISADATRLRQILINLLSNALKFTDPRKQVAVKISVQRDPQVLCFSVTDQGIGMTPEQMSRLFMPFEQADSSMTRKYGGTGLGLSISKLLAEAMGGWIEVQSLPGVGSTFRLLLPLEDDSILKPVTTAVSDQPMLTARLMMPAHKPVSGGRILLVDDSLDLQTLMSYRLRTAGYDVTAAANGRIGMDLALQQPFDVIIMDIQMPEMDGHTASRELRKQGYLGPIIGLSAHALKGEREKSLANGMNEYLTKPVDTEVLKATIRKFLQTGRNAAFFAAQRSPQAVADDELSVMRREFLQGVPDAVASMQASLEVRELDLLARMAHHLKGTAASYGISSLSEKAVLLEEACKEDHRREVLAERVQNLQQEADRLAFEGTDNARPDD